MRGIWRNGDLNINFAILFNPEFASKIPHEFMSTIKFKSEDSEPFRYSCLKCGKTYARKSDLWEHDQRMHKGVIFPCRQCNLSFIRKPFLSKHIKRTHFKTMCYICNFEVGEDDEEQIKSHIDYVATFN